MFNTRDGTFFSENRDIINVIYNELDNYKKGTVILSEAVDNIFSKLDLILNE